MIFTNHFSLALQEYQNTTGGTKNEIFERKHDKG